jgi:hypothetical protein
MPPLLPLLKYFNLYVSVESIQLLVMDVRIEWRLGFVLAIHDIIKVEFYCLIIVQNVFVTRIYASLVVACRRRSTAFYLINLPAGHATRNNASLAVACRRRSTAFYLIFLLFWHGTRNNTLLAVAVASKTSQLQFFFKSRRKARENHPPKLKNQVKKHISLILCFFDLENRAKNLSKWSR